MRKLWSQLKSFTGESFFVLPRRSFRAPLLFRRQHNCRVVKHCHYYWNGMEVEISFIWGYFYMVSAFVLSKNIKTRDIKYISQIFYKHLHSDFLTIKTNEHCQIFYQQRNLYRGLNVILKQYGGHVNDWLFHFKGLIPLRSVAIDAATSNTKHGGRPVERGCVLNQAIKSD